MSDELKVINHFGLNHQQRKLEEEVFELQEAITRYQLIPTQQGINDIKSELADVHFLLNQMQRYFNIDDEELMQEYLFKANRTLERYDI